MYYIYAVFRNYPSYTVYYFSYLLLKGSAKNNKWVLFNTFICFSFFLCDYIWNSSSDVLRYIIILPILALLIMLPFGIIALMFGLFLNARILMKREGRRFTNCLTLLAAFGILFFMLLPIINPASLFSSHFQPIFAGISLITVYFFIHLSNFLSAYFYTNSTDQDVIKISLSFLVAA